MRFGLKSFNIKKKCARTCYMFDQSLSTEQQHVSNIFKRLCAEYNVQNNAELEHHLSLQSGFSEHCIFSATIPYSLIDKTSKATHVSFDYLLNGQNQHTVQLSNHQLKAIKNGIIKSIKKMSMAGLIKGENHNQETLGELAEIHVEQIENELKIQSQVK